MRGWPEIAKGRDVLISAPTGSGKTLAAFPYCHRPPSEARPAGPAA
ncbi:MAG: DEAD/DEAH box helicase [Ignavibacteriota bacterium]